MLSIGRALLLVCVMLVAGPLLLLVLHLPAAAFSAESIARLLPSIIVAALLIAALVAIRVGVIITGPITSLHHAVQRMSADDLTVRAPLPDRFAPRELHQLTVMFNEMASNVSRSRAQVERANASQSEFVRTVTHELRSPLNAIIGFSELLTGRNAARLSPEARDSYLRDINAGARHLQSLVNDLLDLAKAEAGQYVLVEDEVWLEDIMLRAARFIEPEARERQISVTVTLAGDAVCILGDERALFQVLLNLVSNAVRYGRIGGVVNIVCEGVDDRGCVIAVRDDGPGISAEDLERVMLPFQRACGATTGPTVGSGLGLPIVKKLVELHGGSFTLSSTFGSGTTAAARLPSSRVRRQRSNASDTADCPHVAKAA